MNKKKIAIISIVVIFLIVSLVFFVKYILLLSKVNNLNKEFKVCKDKFYKAENYYGAARCFSEIAEVTGKVEYKYYHALALFNMQEFDKSKKELKFVIDNSHNIKNKKLIEKSKNIYDFLSSASEREIIYLTRVRAIDLSKENAVRLDIGDYFSDLGKVAVWENPNKIRVYVENGEKKEILKNAFKIWSKSVGSTLTFIFVSNPDSADITCVTVKKLNDMRLGSTKTYISKKSGKRYLSKANIQIALFDPYEENELENDSILSTTLHEIGHAIGIISHSPQKGDVMYFDSSGYRHKTAQVSNRDINTVKKIYGNI